MAEKIEQQAKREAQALADQAEADAAARYRLPRRNKRNREGEPPSVSRNSPLGVAIERAAMARMIGWPALEASWLEDVERLQAAKGKK